MYHYWAFPCAIFSERFPAPVGAAGRSAESAAVCTTDASFARVFAQGGIFLSPT
jgi:hypothetical protein